MKIELLYDPAIPLLGIFFFFFWLHHAACGILVPLLGIEPRPLAVNARGPNHWTVREFPSSGSFSKENKNTNSKTLCSVQHYLQEPRYGNNLNVNQWMVNKSNVVYRYNGIVFSIKNELNPKKMTRQKLG